MYDKYSVMMPKQMMDKEEEIKRYVFDPVQPISTVFNTITVYKDLCELSGDAITDIAMVKIGYVLMNRSRVLKTFSFKNIFVNITKTWNVWMLWEYKIHK